MLTFNQSKCCTIGLELELQLINKKTFNLANCIQTILALKNLSQLPCIIKPEITKNNLEINSSVHTSIHDLLDELRNMRDKFNDLLNTTDYAVCGGGTHPFHDWKNSEIYPATHYQEIEEKYGYLAKQDTIFGMHIHIGCTSGDDVIYLCHMLSMYVPHLLALSASSPYFREVDTSYHSTRTNISSSFPTAGPLPPFMNWQDFENYFLIMQKHDVIKSINDFYWDIRPQGKFGTAEIRVFDMPLTLEKVCSIAAFVQALSQSLLAEKIKFSPSELYLFYHHNKYQSARYGFQATYIHPISKEHFTLKQHFLETLQKIQGSLDQKFFSLLEKQIIEENNDAALLRKTYQEKNCFKHLVRNQMSLWNEHA